MKYIYTNELNFLEWNLDSASVYELENRELPENQRHVLEHETDKPEHFKWMDGRVIELTEDEKISKGLIHLDDLKKIKTDEVNALCETKILQGFWSNATGTNRHYQSETEDQTNLVGVVTTGLDMPYKCGTQAESGLINYEFVGHTAEQLKHVLQDGSNIKSALLQNANRLKGLIANASNQTELLEINFDGWIQ